MQHNRIQAQTTDFGPGEASWGLAHQAGAPARLTCSQCAAWFGNPRWPCRPRRTPFASAALDTTSGTESGRKANPKSLNKSRPKSKHGGALANWKTRPANVVWGCIQGHPGSPAGDQTQYL